MRAIWLVGAAMLLALTGCAAGSAAPSTAPAPPVVTEVTPGTSSAAPTPPESSASVDPTEAEILRVYAEFMDARNSTLSRPMRAPAEKLQIYAIDPAKNGVLSLAVYYRSKGLRIHGQPISEIESVRVDQSVGTAEVRDCVDSTDSYPVDAKTGKSARAPGDPRRVLVTSTVVQRGQGWVVATWSPDRETPCAD